MDYKVSIYNNKLIISNQHTLIFNSFSGESVLIKDCKINVWEELYSEASSDEKLYHQLVQTGILVHRDMDEPKALENRIQEGINNSDNFILHINPTLDCNFHCWYCYENHISNSMMNSSVCQGVKSLISEILQRPSINHIDICFFGGEPLLFFEKVVKSIICHTVEECEKYKKSFHVNFTTNGYLFNANVIDWLSEYPCSFQITLDGGKHSHDKTRFLSSGKGSYDKIVENIRMLVRKNLPVIVRVNYTAKNIHTVIDVYDSFKDIFEESRKVISFDFQRVWQERENKTDSTEERISEIRSLFINKGFAVHDNFLLHDVRYPCYGDKRNYLLVNYNGDIFKCTARDFSSENRVGFLDSSGKITYNTKVLRERRESKFSKTICKTCRIAPICGGTCTQKSYELRNLNTCSLGLSEEDKDNKVINIIDWAITRKNK